MIRTELSLRLGNSPGALAGVCRLLSNERVNVLAMSLEATASCGWSSTITSTARQCCASTITR